jgi:predicted dehydrogenase
VRAGRHVFCETPAAVDAAGVRTILDVAAEAHARGLSFVSGLHSRHHAATAAIIARVLDGGIGRPLHARATSLVGLPWSRGTEPGWTAAEIAARNWISDDRLSGGSLVEHHVHALDRAIWALGDEPPIAAVAVPAARPLPSPPEGAWAPAATVRYHFAAGRVLDAGIDRRAGTRTEIEEWVRGTSGQADLRRHDAATPNAHQACIAALVRTLRSSGRVDDLATLCRSTMVAIMGRTAAETGGPVAWHDLWPVAAEPLPLRPLQSERV